MKLRITAAAAAGIVLIGLLAWPLAAPPEPFGAVLAGNLSFGNAITLAALALLAGLVAYFLSWPYGREIGILAVPAGLAIWAVRSGNMASLIQLNPTSLPHRQVVFAAIKWEPIFWLAIVGAGFAGVFLGQMIAQQKVEQDETQKKSKASTSLNAVFALVGSVLIAQFLIRIFAQNIRIFDSKLGSVVAQPAIGQIIFAVSLSFGTAAFVVKRFLNASYIWPIAASALVTGFAVITSIKPDILQHVVTRHPAAFFYNAVTSILPIQMVAFGVLGAIAGYWMAVRYNYWRKHELE
jgi:hypothetical protein